MYDLFHRYGGQPYHKDVIYYVAVFKFYRPGTIVGFVAFRNGKSLGYGFAFKSRRDGIKNIYR